MKGITVLTFNLDTLSEALETTGGFMLNPRTGELTGTVEGYAIAVTGTQRVIGSVLTHDAFHSTYTSAVTSVGHTVSPDDVFVIGWWSPERGFMLGLVTVHNVNPGCAELLAMLREQNVLLDLRTNTELFI